MRRLELQNSRSEMYSVGNIVNNCVTRHRDHFEMYRNTESLCCVTGTYSVLGRSYFKNKLIGKKIRFVVSRDERWVEGELDEGRQKVQTSSYKINEY